MDTHGIPGRATASVFPHPPPDECFALSEDPCVRYDDPHTFHTATLEECGDWLGGKLALWTLGNVGLDFR